MDKKTCDGCRHKGHKHYPRCFPCDEYARAMTDRYEEKEEEQEEQE